MENFREALNLAGMGIAVVFLGLALLILALLALGRIFKPVAVAAPQPLSLTDTQAWGAEPQELPPLPLTSTDLPETDIEEMVAIAAAMAAYLADHGCRRVRRSRSGLTTDPVSVADPGSPALHVQPGRCSRGVA